MTSTQTNSQIAKNQALKEILDKNSFNQNRGYQQRASWRTYQMRYYGVRLGTIERLFLHLKLKFANVIADLSLTSVNLSQKLQDFSSFLNTIAQNILDRHENYLEQKIEKAKQYKDLSAGH